MPHNIVDSYTSTKKAAVSCYIHELTSGLSCMRPEHNWSASFITAALVTVHDYIQKRRRPYLVRTPSAAGEPEY